MVLKTVPTRNWKDAHPKAGGGLVIKMKVKREGLNGGCILFEGPKKWSYVLEQRGGSEEEVLQCSQGQREQGTRLSSTSQRQSTALLHRTCIFAWAPFRSPGKEHMRKELGHLQAKRRQN